MRKPLPPWLRSPAVFLLLVAAGFLAALGMLLGRTGAFALDAAERLIVWMEELR